MNVYTTLNLPNKEKRKKEIKTLFIKIKNATIILIASDKKLTCINWNFDITVRINVKTRCSGLPIS